ncbi:MAG: FHA domain-containing protein [Victivallales bacterium]|nr:FHA domain-containing protein [Victivallales bacterium]
MVQQKPSGTQPGNYNETTIKMVSGAMRGTEVPIRKPVVTLGRSSEADIQIHDVLISRVHTKLEWENGQWHIEDLASTNGTWMVGRKVEKRVTLPMKTSVRIGNTLFELINIYAADTQSFSRPFVAYSIQPETLAPSRPEDESSQSLHILREENQRLAAVYKFQNMIAAVLDERELYSRILSAVMNVIAADNAYLLVYDLDSGRFTPVTGRNEMGMLDEIEPDSIKDTIVEFVGENKESALSIDDSEEKRRFKELAGVPNIITSIMCVPMLGKRQINGMIYMSLTSATEKYTEDDLRLLTVIGHTAGMAVENSRLVEFNLRNERLVATGSTAAGLSHYIKNILAGLDGSLCLLKMGIDEKDFDMAGEAASILSKNHRRLGNLVLDLLNLASEQKPEFEICDINAVIRDVVELISPQLDKERVRIHTNEIIDTPIFVEIDSKGIHRVLLNLFTNSEEAILSKKDMPSDAEVIGNIMVSVKFNDNKDYIIISVSDDGVGVAKDETSSMFDLFVTSKGTVGTGLGLAVSKRIVVAHEGSITATGEKGKGCTVAFSLPVTHNDMTTATRTITRMT